MARQVPQLTFSPNNLHAWIEIFTPYAEAKYPVAGRILSSRRLPTFMSQTEEDLLPTKREEIQVEGEAKDDQDAQQATLSRTVRYMPQHGTYEYDKFNRSLRSLLADQRTFETESVQLFAEMQRFMSPQSSTKITKFKEEFAKAHANNSVLSLLTLIEHSHTHAGKAPSFLEKKSLWKILESTCKQGVNLSLDEHNRTFESHATTLRNMGGTLDEVRLVFAYVQSLNASFNDAVQRLLEKEHTKEFPTQFVDALSHFQKVDERKDATEPAIAQSAHLASTGSVCAFCDRHGHTANNCRLLAQYKSTQASAAASTKARPHQDNKPQPQKEKEKQPPPAPEKYKRPTKPPDSKKQRGKKSAHFTAAAEADDDHAGDMLDQLMKYAFGMQSRRSTSSSDSDHATSHIVGGWRRLCYSVILIFLRLYCRMLGQWIIIQHTPANMIF
jgi:hypothetical protein